MTDYLTRLNPEQRDAVETIDGPLLVLAGAGTGKTQVLTTRFAHILLTGRASPGQALAVTFTTKTARELRERVGATPGPAGRQDGTGHALHPTREDTAAGHGPCRFVGKLYGSPPVRLGPTFETNDASLARRHGALAGIDSVTRDQDGRLGRTRLRSTPCGGKAYRLGCAGSFGQSGCRCSIPGSGWKMLSGGVS